MHAKVCSNSQSSDEINVYQSERSSFLICCHSLPTAYVVRREGYVRSTTGRLCFDSCLSFGLSTPGGGGTLMGGYPTSGSPHSPSDLTGRVPQWGVPHLRYPPLLDLAGGVPHLRYPPLSCRTWPGGGVPHLGSTWYAAVGMPLAFTQEHFLV